MISATRAQRRELDRQNAKQPLILREIPKDEWPLNQDKKLHKVYRSRDFLVQVLIENDPVIVRMSVCRTTVLGDSWEDGITWEELQRLKRECGYGDYDAIEIYPADRDIVNVANMRHLWVMKDPIKCAWRKPG